jgi:hypothetical protein
LTVDPISAWLPVIAKVRSDFASEAMLVAS